MPSPKEIVQALNKSFPRPRVDSEWLEQCCAWITEEKHLSPINDFDKFLENVNEQLIKSDLSDSMHHGTGLKDISTFTGSFSGPPLLVQIIEITDIGVSAFQLEQVRAVREERMLAGEGNEEGDEDGDLEVEGEGPLPKYPKATLQLRLSDGQTLFSAMEYRPIPQLVLGTTPLGFKLQLNGTRFSNGIAFLEPETIILIGGSADDLESQQPIFFKQSLYQRMGRPIQEEPPLAPAPNHPSRAPLREISPSAPTMHDDDVDMEPRRRLPTNPTPTEQPNSTSSLNTPRTIRPLPTRQPKSTETESARGRPSISNPMTAAQSSSTSPHFSGNAGPQRMGQPVNRATDNALDFSFSPTTRQQASAFSANSPMPTPAKAKQSRSGRVKNDSFDFDLLDEVDSDENAPPKLKNKGKGRAVDEQKKALVDGDSSDYGMDDDNTFADSAFLESLDRVEKQAMEGRQRSIPPNSTVNYSQGSSISKTANPTPASDVIEIEDESDGDKENDFVPMRHVRQRREEHSELTRGRSPTTSQRWGNSQTSNQKKGKGAVKSTNFNDVIDISDSDSEDKSLV